MQRSSSIRPVHNYLLASLAPADFALLEPHLEPTPLPVRKVLVQSSQVAEEVYFIESGLASVISMGDDGARLEVGLFGRDGMSACFLVLGIDQTPQETFMQLEGSGLRLGAAALAAALDESISLRLALAKFVQAFSIQTAHTAVANGNYKIEERLARWLLMCHDRIDGNDLHLTHDFLGLMLAVQRSGVTLAVQTLEGAGVIKAERGRIGIIDRAKLEEVADGSYGTPEAEYGRLICPLRRRSRPHAVVANEAR